VNSDDESAAKENGDAGEENEDEVEGEEAEAEVEQIEKVEKKQKKIKTGNALFRMQLEEEERMSRRQVSI
jgi:hypothetical protein